MRGGNFEAGTRGGFRVEFIVFNVTVRCYGDDLQLSFCARRRHFELKAIFNVQTELNITSTLSSINRSKRYHRQRRHAYIAQYGGSLPAHTISYLGYYI